MPIPRTPYELWRNAWNSYRRAIQFVDGLLVPPANAPTGTGYDYGVPKPAHDATSKPSVDVAPPAPSFELPDRPPRIRIKLPPIKIFDPDNPPVMRVIYPELPPRVLPEPQPSPEKEFTSEVGNSLATREYGCLLANPLYSGELEFCYYEEVSTNDFFIIIIDKILQYLEELVRQALNIEDPETIVSNACKLGVALLPIQYYEKPIMIIGCDYFGEIADYYQRRNLILNSFPISGKIHIGNLNFKKCDLPQKEAEDNQDFDLGLSNECAIPLSMYDQTEGYKVDQLQVIYRNLDWEEQRKPRQFSLPSPRSDLTIGMIKTAVPLTWRSGKAQVDIFMILTDYQEGVKPIYKTTLFTNHENQQQVEDFVYMQFRGWLDALTQNVIIKNYQAKFHDNFDIFVGSFRPHRAVQLGWDRDKKKWFTKADWNL